MGKSHKKPKSDFTKKMDNIEKEVLKTQNLFKI